MGSFWEGVGGGGRVRRGPRRVRGRGLQSVGERWGGLAPRLQWQLLAHSALLKPMKRLIAASGRTRATDQTSHNLQRHNCLHVPKDITPSHCWSTRSGTAGGFKCELCTTASIRWALVLASASFVFADWLVPKGSKVLQNSYYYKVQRHFVLNNPLHIFSNSLSTNPIRWKCPEKWVEGCFTGFTVLVPEQQQLSQC